MLIIQLRLNSNIQPAFVFLAALHFFNNFPVFNNKLRMSFICHIHNYTEYNEEWNVFSAFNPSKCTHLEQWAGDCAAPGEQSWTSCRSRNSNPQPWVTSGFKSNTLSIRPLGYSLWAFIQHPYLYICSLIKAGVMHQIAVIIWCDDNSAVRNFKADLFHPSKTFFQLIKSAQWSLSHTDCSWLIY